MQMATARRLLLAIKLLECCGIAFLGQPNSLPLRNVASFEFSLYV
jgi:hypothetical protein